MLRPLIIGEVLFDIFSDSGELFLGGAPFNVAWNLKGFGLEPLFVSRVGDDKEASIVIEKMKLWGMDRSGLQIDNKHSTGRVLVEMSGTSHLFDILPDMAYDFIEREPILSLMKDNKFSLLYHGTLAMRSRVSNDTLDYISSFSSLPIFVDINLRKPYWTYSSLIDLLSSGIRWLKLNDEEFKEIVKSLALERKNILYNKDSMIELSKEIMSLYPSLELIILTLGDKGGIICSGDNVFSKRPSLSSVVDTVGAGDAFASVVLLGIIKSWDTRLILDRALDFARVICGIKGALCNDRSIYLNFRKSWSLG